MTPTRLGNAIRSFETYGGDHYNLDSQAFWSELMSCVPEELRKEYQQSRAGVDFFVSLLYLSALFGSLAVAVSLGTETPTLWIPAILAFLLCNRLAYVNTSAWAEATKAIVNVGRKPLAAALGFQLPSTIERERQMWGLVNEFVFYPFDREMAAKLDRFRFPGQRGGEPG